MSKIEQLQASLVDQQLDAAYISDPMTIGYLTGFYEDPIERVMALVVFADAEPFLFTPALEVEAAKGAGWTQPVYGYLDHENPYELIADHVKSTPAHQSTGESKKAT